MRNCILCPVVVFGLLLGGMGCHSDGGGSASRPGTYQYPLTSVGSKFLNLPLCVQNTVRAEVGTAEVADISRETTNSQIFYKVSFRKQKLYPPLYIAPDGSVLNPDLTLAVSSARDGVNVVNKVSGLKLGDLPPEITRTVEKQVPDGEVDVVAKETQGDKVVYIVSFKDLTRHPPVRIAPDGSLVPEPRKP